MIAAPASNPLLLVLRIGKKEYTMDEQSNRKERKTKQGPQHTQPNGPNSSVVLIGAM